MSLALVSVIWFAFAFGLDLSVELGVSMGLFYLGPIVLSLWSPNQRHTWSSAAVATVLTGLGMLLSPDGGEVWKVLANRVLSLFAIWGTAVAVLYQQGTRDRLEEEILKRHRILSLTGAMFLRVNPAGFVTLANPKVARVLGRDVLGTRWLDLLDPADHVVAESLMAQIQETPGATVSVELPVPTPHGRRCVVWDSVEMDDGQVLMSGIDITDRKLAERALREKSELARLGAMAAAVAHEVRNPLAGINGALDVIGRRLPNDSPERDIVSKARRRLIGLNDAIDHLLRYARPREPRIEHVAIGDVLAETRAVLASDPRVEGVEVVIDATEAVVLADPELLCEAIVALALNAAQAMKGKGVLHISTTEREGACAIDVTDEGPGIPIDARDRLFEPFYTTGTAGNGLGLAIVQRTISAHGGTITIQSPPGGGTTFAIQLPLPLV